MQHIHENTHLLNAFTLTLFASNQCRQRSRIERLFAEVVAETVEIGHCTEHTRATHPRFLSFRHIDTRASTQTRARTRTHTRNLVDALFPLPQPALSLSCTSLSCPLALCISLFRPLIPLFPFLLSPRHQTPSSPLMFAQSVCTCVCKHVVSMCVFQVSDSVIEV